MRLTAWTSFGDIRSCLWPFVLPFVAKCESLLVPSLAPSWFYRCPSLRLVSTYILCFALFVPSRIFLDRTTSGQYRPCRLFVSPRYPPRALSVAAVSFLLWVVFMWPVLPSLRFAPFAHMGSVTSPPLLPSSAMVVYYVSSLYVSFVFLFYACVSQPIMSRGVVLYEHMKCRGSWVPPGFLLALSRTLLLSSDL